MVLLSSRGINFSAHTHMGALVMSKALALVSHRAEAGSVCTGLRGSQLSSPGPHSTPRLAWGKCGTLKMPQVLKNKGVSESHWRV